MTTMFYVLFTYEEFGFGPMYTFTAHMSEYAANEAIVEWMSQKPHANHKIIKGEVISQGP